MNWNEIIITVPVDQIELAEAIANMVVPYGIYVEDYSDLEQGAMEIAHIDMIDEQLISKDRNVALIHIYISEEENPLEHIAFLRERFSSEKIEFSINSDKICDADWADNWKKYFKVSEIGNRLVIRPSWEEYDNKDNRVVLSIDPGAAFGTGTHATTKMCLELIDEFCDETVNMLDIGCGSGILSIAGALLGSESVVGVDIDDTAVKVSKENAQLNGVQNKCEFIVGDLAEKINDKFSIVCANIVADVIIHLSKDVAKYLKDDGIFLCSGIIDIRENEVREALLKNGFTIIAEKECENWRAFAVKTK